MEAFDTNTMERLREVLVLTTEGLEFEGRGEGISAHAVASVESL